jgi:hypothetical protein
MPRLTVRGGRHPNAGLAVQQPCRSSRAELGVSRQTAYRWRRTCPAKGAGGLPGPLESASRLNTPSDEFRLRRGFPEHPMFPAERSAASRGARRRPVADRYRSRCPRHADRAPQAKPELKQHADVLAYFDRPGSSRAKRRFFCDEYLCPAQAVRRGEYPGSPQCKIRPPTPRRSCGCRKGSGRASAEAASSFGVSRGGRSSAPWTPPH